MCNGMNEKELINVTINEYCDLLRIKRCMTCENAELNFQIKQKEIKLSSFGVNVKELKFEN